MANLNNLGLSLKWLASILLVFFFVSVFEAASDNAKYVNMFLGSSGDHGQTTPGAAIPFGMISVCPDSNPNQHGGYDYSVAEISGVSINRISGVGCYGTGGNISVRPAPEKSRLEIVKGTEKAFPGYYETFFSNGVLGKFTASRAVAIEKYLFPHNAVEKVLSVDFSSSFDRRKVSCGYQIIDSNTIEGWVVSPTACARGTYKIWFTLSSDKAFSIKDTTSTSALLEYDASEVEIRIAISPIDQKTSRGELSQVSQRTFDKVLRDARRMWCEKLRKIQVKGSTNEQRVLLYTSLYRIYLSPMDVTSFDGKYKGTDGETYYLEQGQRYYSCWCMWDTFRTKFPMLTILEPDIMSDISSSIVSQFRTGKKNWATDNESCPTVRTEHSIIMLLDSYVKGIRDIKAMAGYRGMLNEAIRDYPNKTFDNQLETSYDLWALAKLSKILGKDEETKELSSRSEKMFEKVWKSEFMNVTEDFDRMKDNGLYQGTRWQYRWAAPQYLDKMIEWEGRERLEKELDEFFEGNHFNQGNEPDIHTPFIYNKLGAPKKCQQTVRNLLTNNEMVHRFGGNAEYQEPYVGRAFQNKLDGYAPEMDEDDGAMSAWYMFCQMGFYPLVPGTDKYELSSPLFDHITIKTGYGTLKIKVRGRKDDSDPIRKVLVDNKKVEGTAVSHSVFLKNHTVRIYY